MQYVMDIVHELREERDLGSVLDVSPEEYVQYIVERAEEDGVAQPDDVRAWTTGYRGEHASDPRVQAFLSSAVEGLAQYLSRMGEQREVISRYLETRPDSIHFSGIGQSGELYFRHGDDAYLALTDDEVAQVANDRVAWGLAKENPAILLRYTDLPDEAMDILTAAQKRPEDEANQVLAGMVDVPALADDLVRQRGHGWLASENANDVLGEARFGDRVIVRFRQPEEGTGAG